MASATANSAREPVSPSIDPCIKRQIPEFRNRHRKYQDITPSSDERPFS
jgi:hypothetical protein